MYKNIHHFSPLRRLLRLSLQKKKKKMNALTLQCSIVYQINRDYDSFLKPMFSSSINNSTPVTGSLAILPLTLKPKGSASTAQEPVLQTWNTNRSAGTQLRNHCLQTLTANCRHITCQEDRLRGTSIWACPTGARYWGLTNTRQITSSQQHVWVIYGTSTNSMLIEATCLVKDNKAYLIPPLSSMETG